MSETLPVVYLARHGETPWAITGQHAGRVDLPLTEHGERNARQLGERLSGLTFAKVFTSRRPPDGGDIGEATRLAAVPRRIPRRRIAAAGRGAG
jgi:hypothetical protein